MRRGRLLLVRGSVSRRRHVSAFAHQQLREKLKTPLLITEHVRGVEPKADFVLAGGTDMLRVDPEYDMGITGSLKIAHLAESLGWTWRSTPRSGPSPPDVGAAQFELLRGRAGRARLPERDSAGVYAAATPTSSTASTPMAWSRCREGPGLGVTLDWDYIEKHRSGTACLRVNGAHVDQDPSKNCAAAGY